MSASANHHVRRSRIAATGPRVARGRLLALVGLVLAATLADCTEEKVQGIGGGGFGGDLGTTLDGSSHKKDGDGNDITTAEDGSQNGNDATAAKKDGGSTGGGDGGVDYPSYKYTGDGQASCNGEVGLTKAGVETSMDDKTMTLDTPRARLLCYQIDKCEQSKADDEVNRSVGKNEYTRISDNDLDKLTKAGTVESGKYAIFATAVTFRGKDGSSRQFNFDKPLPVFPQPAPPSRYTALKGSKVWTAHVTGARSFDVNIRLDVVKAETSEVVIKLTTTIAQDTNRSLYEVFPLPREATYTMDPNTRRVTDIKVVSWFHGDNCGGHPETVNMEYRICAAKVGSKPAESLGTCY